MNLKKPKPFYLHEEDRNIKEINKLLFDFIYKPKIYLNQDPWTTWPTWPEPKTGDNVNRYIATTTGDLNINTTITTTPNGNYYCGGSLTPSTDYNTDIFYVSGGEHIINRTHTYINEP